MQAAGERGSIVSLLCDGGERYARMYFNDDWLRDNGIDLEPHAADLARWLA